MQVDKTQLDGVLLIKPEVFEDYNQRHDEAMHGLIWYDKASMGRNYSILRCWTSVAITAAAVPSAVTGGASTLVRGIDWKSDAGSGRRVRIPAAQSADDLHGHKLLRCGEYG